VSGVAWKPDGSALAFIANEFQRDEYTYPRADLWTVTLEGKTTRLTNDGYDHDSPAWSPDGRMIAVRREQGLSAVIAGKQNFGAPNDIFTIAATGGALTNITSGWDLLPGPPSWSPDGRFVYFTGGTGGSDHLFRASTAGASRTVEQITTGDRQLSGFSQAARWGPDGVRRRRQRPTRRAVHIVDRRPQREEADVVQRRPGEGGRSRRC
jgi:Tol biopolymer transport system component